MQIDHISKARLKFLQSLKLKKNREKYDVFVIEGYKILKDVLLADPRSIQEIYMH